MAKGSVLVRLGAGRRTIVWLVCIGVVGLQAVVGFWESGNDGDCPVGVSVWTLASVSLQALGLFSVTKTHLPPNRLFSKRRARDALVSCQTKKVRMNEEGPPAKAVPEAVRNRPTPHSAPFKAVLQCVRNRAPLAPEGTPPQERQTWPRPPSAPPLGRGATTSSTVRVCTGARHHQRHAASVRSDVGVRGPTL